MFGYDYQRMNTKNFSVWNLKTDKLKNFYQRAVHVLRTKFNWSDFDYCGPVAPKKLAVVLYTQMMQEHHARMENAKQIVRLNQHIQKLNDEIARLEDIEKNNVYARYIARLYRYTWHCGDGCCSESQYYMVVFDEAGEVVQRPDREGTYRYDHLIKNVKEKFGSALEIHQDNDVEEKNEIPGYFC